MPATTWHDEGVDDHAFIRALRAGDRDAFAELVDREAAAVYRTCLRILGRREDAEDVTQESFVAAFRALRTYRGSGSPRGWLMRIAQRQAYRRLAQRRPGAELHQVDEARLADRSADPERAAALAETRDEVHDAVAALPEPYRETVSLRFFGELSLAEVAEATGRPLATVKTHLRRGLERLRHVFGAEANR